MIRIVCYGAGERFDQFIRTVDFDKVVLTAIADKNIEAAKAKSTLLSLKGIAIMPIEIPFQVFDYVVICSDLYTEEMQVILLNLGVDRSKICFAGCVPITLSRCWDFNVFIDHYCAATNKNKEILSRMVVSDIPAPILIRDMLNLRRARRLSDFYSKAKRDFVRVSTLELIADQIIMKNIEGSVAELGVYKGEFAILINELFPNKDFYLFDTFEGFNEKNYIEDNEYGYISNSNAVGFFKDTSVEAVLSKMPNRERCIVKQGLFPDSLGDMQKDQNKQFCFVSIDADLYLPTYEGIKYFYPRLSVGGYIIVHDYECPTFKGARVAVDTICEEMGISFVPLSDENGSIVITKQRYQRIGETT